MDYKECEISHSVHRLIPSRFPPILLFDWVQTPEELEEIAALEGLTNERLQSEYGNIHLVAKEDWILGPGSTPLMAAFTHPGLTRFTDGTFGAYYAAETLDTAIAETKFHREKFLTASQEPPCRIQMREYLSKVQKKLIDLSQGGYETFLDPDPQSYPISQAFGREMREKLVWGLYYPSVRAKGRKCVAIFRPPALTIPIQGCHLDYIWDGEKIAEISIAKSYELRN